MEDQQLPDYCIGPITTTHIFRWSAAIENWHRIHYDKEFAVGHDKLPDVLMQGSWKQSIIPQYLKDWVLPEGWVWKASFQHRAMLVPGDLLTVWGRVIRKYEAEDLGYVDLEIGIKNQANTESCPGFATVLLPFRDGRKVPYPFIKPSQ
ncbi:MAG: acyl dehydratase [Dehalococcoidia bacterium]|nr:acyl dehydratase [Dehalococcoidia bacterium]